MTYRDGKMIFTGERHNFVLHHGALGDMLTSLPAIASVGPMYSRVMDLRVWVPHYQVELVQHLLAPYGKFTVRNFTEFPHKFADRKADPEFGTVSYNAPVREAQCTRNRVHLVDFAFLFLIDGRPESMSERSYLTKASVGPSKVLDPKYVVFPVGATSENKLFRASVMRPIMEWCREQGYLPVVVGTKNVQTHVEGPDGALAKLTVIEQTDLLPKELYADWREQTTLLELRDLLAGAKAVVGVDGGTLHLAGTTDVPIIYASGTTLPKHRYIPRHGDHNYRIRYVGPRDLECAGCQSNWRFTRWDFRECVYQDVKCMEKLDPEDFINGLKELGL